VTLKTQNFIFTFLIFLSLPLNRLPSINKKE